MEQPVDVNANEELSAVAKEVLVARVQDMGRRITIAELESDSLMKMLTESRKECVNRGKLINELEAHRGVMASKTLTTYLQHKLSELNAVFDNNEVSASAVTSMLAEANTECFQLSKRVAELEAELGTLKDKR